MAASHTVNSLLDPDAAARLVEQKLFDPSLPGLQDVIDRLMAASFGASASGAYEQEVKRAVEGVVVERVEWLAQNAAMPQVRAIATASLRATRGDLVAMADDAHAAMLAQQIQRFLDRPAATVSVPRNRGRPAGSPDRPAGARLVRSIRDRRARHGLARSWGAMVHVAGMGMALTERSTRRFTDREVALVLRAATEIDESEGSGTGAGGISLDDLREIAREVGISGPAIERAVAQLDRGGRVGASWAGAHSSTRRYGRDRARWTRPRWLA